MTPTRTMPPPAFHPVKPEPAPAAPERWAWLTDGWTRKTVAAALLLRRRSEPAQYPFGDNPYFNAIVVMSLGQFGLIADIVNDPWGPGAAGVVLVIVVFAAMALVVLGWIRARRRHPTPASAAFGRFVRVLRSDLRSTGERVNAGDDSNDGFERE